ncbi:MAG: hypothetical protein ABSG21_08970 [Spirochaetia bacterium]|jgi:hypothetical protein
MRKFRHFAIPAVLMGLLTLFAGCPTVPVKEVPVGINNSDVYRLAQEALQPVADQFVERGDRILLVNTTSFYGSDAWRFAPIPPEFPQDAFENIIRPAARETFTKSDSPELKLLGNAFSLETSKQDASKKVYTLKTTAEGYSDLLLGRILHAAHWSGINPFSLTEFVHANPYFIDSFESGLLRAVLKKQAKGFERLESAAADQGNLKDRLAQFTKDHGEGRIVFGTNPLDFVAWKDMQKKYSVSKLLMYSVDNVIVSGTDYIGMQAAFRLVDIARGGRLLWSGTKTMTSEKFPPEKVPFLGAVRLTLPQQVTGGQRDAFGQALKDQGVKLPASAVLMKIDDIPVFGTYPVTREDFAVENALQGLFSSIPGLTVVEKLYKRQYRQPWQMAHSVHYVTPLLGGDYNEFQNYYGARYMIGYRVLWKDLQGVQVIQGDKDLELSGKLLGIYVKVVDMGDSGRIILSDFIPLASDSDLDRSVLYRCYGRTKALAVVPSALRDSGVITDTTRVLLVNRRMEIANNYIGEGTAAEGFITGRMLPPDQKPVTQKTVMMSYFNVYEVLRTFGEKKEKKATPLPAQGGAAAPKETIDQTQELNLTMAVNLMQSWFEDGLCTALTAGDAAPNEKLESLYSRYFVVRSAAPKEPSEELLYLSPLLLSRWGQVLKGFYNVDKLVYFSLLETRTPSSPYIKIPISSPLARFFPLVSTQPDSLQVSVVNIATGDYEYKQDFALK